MFKRRKQEGSKDSGGTSTYGKVLPYWDIHENIMVLRDGRLVYGVYFEPPSHIHYTSDDLLRRQSTLKSVFDLAVPEGETFRTYTSLRGALEEEVEDTRRYAEACPDPVLKELTLTRAHMLEARILSGEVSHWKFFATVTVTPPSDLRFSMDEPPSPEELQRAVETAQGYQMTLVAQMSAAGFAAQPMTRQDVFAECFYWLNPGWPVPPEFIPQEEREVRSLRRGRADHLTLLRQLGCTVVDNLPTSGPIVGDRYVEVISLGRLPEYTETGYLKQVTESLHGTYYVIVEATRENDYDVSNALEKQKTDLFTRVRAPGVIPNGRAKNLLEDVEAAQGLEGVESRFEAGVSVVLVAQSQQELERMKRRARANLTRLRAGAPISYGFQSIAQYFALAPFTANQSHFLFQPYTSNVIDLFPPVSPWKGFDEGAITFQSRDKSLIRFDLFTPQTRTAHFAIFAPTGSGKTVLALSLFNAHLTKYPDSVLVVTDAKKDFQYFFKSLEDHAIIEFGYNSQNRFNIFDLEEGAVEPDGTKLSALIQFVRLFVERSADAREKDYEDVAISEAILATYKQFKDEERRPQLGDVQKMLNAIEAYTDTGRNMEPEVIRAARSVAIRLRKGLGASPLAPIVDCQSNVKLTARRIYLSAYGIPEGDDLMKRVAHHIAKGIQWKVAKEYPRRVKKFIFMDEFENMIQTEEEVTDVKRMLRVFRSFGVSFGIGTQDPAASDYFGALKDSFAHLFVGGFSESVARGNAERRGVVEILSLPKVMEEKLPTLNNLQDKYSEFALLTLAANGSSGRVGDIIQVQESKLALWLFNSGNAEVDKKDRYVEQAGGDVLRGVKSLVDDLYGSYV
ncbi:VirB4 family type IV secretion system protein [Deinococcus metallilatus]|uniref:DUF87 domain-containing protein n=1 Tax=Deinococcus metallilatus TaxID=1211322 RepID=A0AAJ5F0K0_9DEIO|nr:DUF87 domain-containing protein [Deinococcus metallilatus]MBB5297215.1 hypothetical protein [Deinococcus metallilatus]RXJ17354.1 DUF87 domain-containing protein [Deinococcus metallilatus]TLK21823.1 DUF87 domain-containing protein [Deinococcus metallilatus]GMA17220.1 hypothetical protein GCM10025871_35510 [Deinococcus metallilatus]